MTEQTRATWQAALLGTVVSDTVTEETTGATGSYSWTVDNVLWDGFSERLRVVLNDGNGGYREFAFDGTGSTQAAITTIGEALAAQVIAGLQDDLLAGLVGEVL
jgi:hypothetical protein